MFLILIFLDTKTHERKRLFVVLTLETMFILAVVIYRTATRRRGASSKCLVFQCFTCTKLRFHAEKARHLYRSARFCRIGKQAFQVKWIEVGKVGAKVFSLHAALFLVFYSSNSSKGKSTMCPGRLLQLDPIYSCGKINNNTRKIPHNHCIEDTKNTQTYNSVFYTF